LEIADSKKRLEKLSEKFKIACALLYLAIVWIFAILFSLPMVLSFKEGVSLDDSFVCDTSWNNTQVNISY